MIFAKEGVIRARISALLFVLVPFAGVASAQERGGNIAGTVVDSSGGVVPGVSVTATNDENKRVLSTVTNGEGAFVLRDVEPGRYTIKLDLQGFGSVQTPNVIVLLGATAPLNSKLSPAGVQAEVVVVAQATTIDTQATTRQRNIPAEEFDTIPKGRSFQSLVAALPSVNQGELEGGIQVGGASAGENNFTVDGVTVNSQINGGQRQDAVFEYLQEVQVKTSGLEAEFGGAIGGVVSAVTKSGGNTFHGTFFEHYSGSALSANNGVAKRLVIDPATQNTASIIQDNGQTSNRNEVGFSMGGPIVRDRLFFFGSASPRFDTVDRDYTLAGNTTYALNRSRTSMSLFGKITWAPTSRLRANVSALYTPDKAEGSIPGYNGGTINSTTSTAANLAASQARGFEVPQWNMAFNADYTIGSSALLSIRGGYMSDDYFDTGVNKGQTYEYVTSAVGLPGVPSQFQQPAGFSNLPRVQINERDLTTRRSVDASISKVFSAGGSHSLKGGFGVSRATNDVELAYPNRGYVSVFWDSTFTSDATGRSGRGTYGYYTIDSIGTIGETGANIKNVFIQDSWEVNPKLTLNIGVRSENEDIPSFRPDIAKVGIQFSWKEKIAPRLGVAYDLFGDGRAKISGSFGRYYDWTKYELARGSFGGDTWTTRYRSLDDPDPTKLSAAALTGRNLWTSAPDSFKDSRIPSFGSDVVDPNMKPMAQNAFNAGLEYQLAGSTVLGVNFVRNELVRTIEDIGTLVDGSEAYIYGNPGEGLAKTAITTGATAAFVMPKAIRNYTALELSLNRRFTKNWFVGGSYVYSRLYGNYPGLVNTDEVTYPGRVSVGAQEAFGQRTRPGTNASRAWDLDELMFDSKGNFVEGLLPTDRPHVAKVYGSYMLKTGTTVGLNVLASSGTPVSKSVQSIYRYPLLVDGRGSLGRTPFLSQTDLLVSHTFRLGGSKKLGLEFNGLNVFNQQQARHLFDTVNRIGANGRVLASSALRLATTNLERGYNYDALLAATPDAAKPAGTAGAGYRDPRYLMGDLFNTGFVGRVVARFLF